MKKLLFILFLTSVPSFAATWYVNSSGGPRYSATENPTGTCDGTTSSAPVGTTPNQHCAFNDIRWLWTDGRYVTDPSAGAPAWGWIGSGGDTYLIDCTGMPGGSCRIGYSGPDDYHLALAGDPGESGAPPPPSGTSGTHTKILGVNYASCTGSSAKAFVNGGYGTGGVFHLNSVSYVDMACFDITDHSSCGRGGMANQCNTTVDPIDDYANDGIDLYSDTTNTTLTDINIHGMANTGMGGPTGDGVSLLRVRVAGNGGSGWNLDPGDGTTGTGTLTLSYFTTEWNGCDEEYPIVDANPYMFCSDQSSGGYGDGLGTATVQSSPAWLFNVDHSVARYNTQDGFDLLHLQGGGSMLTITNSMGYGNMGQQIKTGAAATVTNNLIVGNCYAMSYAIPGSPPQISAFTAIGGLDVNFTGTLTTGSNIVTGVSSTAGIQVGFIVYAGSSLYAGTTVTAIGSGTLTLSSNALTTGTQGMDAGSPMLTSVSDTSGTITVGQLVGGTGIRVGTYIVSYDSSGHTISLSQGIGGTAGTAFTQQYNSALSDFCRAGNSAAAVAVSDIATTHIEFNTMFSANAIGWEIAPGANCDASCAIVFKNNVFFGFPTSLEPNPNGSNSNPIYLDDGVISTLFTNPGSVMSNNATYGGSRSCPITGFGEANPLCTDPQLVDESWHHWGYGNMTPASASSAVVGVGVAISGITTDFNGTSRPNPPTMGAFEFSSPSSTTFSTSGSIVFSGSVSY